MSLFNGGGNRHQDVPPGQDTRYAAILIQHRQTGDFIVDNGSYRLEYAATGPYADRLPGHELMRQFPQGGGIPGPLRLRACIGAHRLEQISVGDNSRQTL